MLIDPQDPMRPPDWRWRYAMQALKCEKGSMEVKNVRCSLISDPHLCLALQAQFGMMKETDRLQKSLNSGVSHLSEIFPQKIQHVLNAEKLASSRLGNSDYWLYKSLVLGRAPTSILTQLLDKSPDSIAVHNPIFFDVEQTLEDETYIWYQVIRTDTRKGLQDNVEGLWQECAYLGGYDRMLYLRARGIRKDLFRSSHAMQHEKPSMKDYLNPEKVSRNILHVVERRMDPDSQRTIGDLRKLYLTLPGKSQPGPASFNPTGYQKKSIISNTSFEVVNPVTGLRQRCMAEVIDDSTL